MSEKEEAELVEQELEIDRLEGERNDWKAKAGILTAEVERLRHLLETLNNGNKRLEAEVERLTEAMERIAHEAADPEDAADLRAALHPGEDPS